MIFDTHNVALRKALMTRNPVELIKYAAAIGHPKMFSTVDAAEKVLHKLTVALPTMPEAMRIESQVWLVARGYYPGITPQAGVVKP